MKTVTFLFFLLLFSSCNRKFNLYQGAGTLTIRASNEVTDASFSFNSQKLFDNKNFKKIIVTGCPEGENTYRISSESKWLSAPIMIEDTVTIKKNLNVQINLDTPGYSPAYYLVNAALIGVSALLLLAL